MKFSSVLAIALCVAVVSAVPHYRHGHNSNYEDNRNYEDNSNNENKQINQGIGSVGSSKSHGLLGGGLLGGGILSDTKNTNNVNQNAKIN